MSDKVSEPRRWILGSGGPGFQAPGVALKGPEVDGLIEVVESKAYDKLKADRDRLKSELEKCRAKMVCACTYDLICPKCLSVEALEQSKGG